MANLTLAVTNILPDNPLELARRHLDHCRVVSLRDSEVFLKNDFFCLPNGHRLPRTRDV